MLKLKNRRTLYIVIIFTAVVTLTGLTLALSHPLRRNVRISFETVLARIYKAPTEAYPNIPTENLNDTQKRIVQITQQEYNKKPVSFDTNVQIYSQGAKEPWCANFASWVMKQAGQPFNNPVSGNWRIPGVYTLHEYFLAQKTYREAGSYTPKTGDVALYLDGRGHTNIVISVDNGLMTTIGGNETGHLRLNTQKYTKGTEGLSGFGELII